LYVQWLVLFPTLKLKISHYWPGSGQGNSGEKRSWNM